MSTQRTCHVTNSITFSQALAVGLTHYDWLHKTEDEIAGQEAVHASHSVRPESVEAQRTRDTCGPLFGGLSPSADLARSSGSRLRALTDLNGSPEYELTWSVWAMPFGEPIIRLRALGRRTDGSGCSGWPTTSASDGYPQSPLPEKVAMFFGTPSPRMAAKLAAADAALAGWPTPMAQNKDAGNCDHSRQVEVMAGQREPKNSPKLAGWNTPRATDGSKGGPNQSGGALPADAALATLGPMPNGSPAATEKRGVLNPALSAWLMGYPEEIISCVDWGTR
jgi:hypothetical protein